LKDDEAEALSVRRGGARKKSKETPVQVSGWKRGHPTHKTGNCRRHLPSFAKENLPELVRHLLPLRGAVSGAGSFNAHRFSDPMRKEGGVLCWASGRAGPRKFRLALEVLICQVTSGQKPPGGAELTGYLTRNAVEEKKRKRIGPGVHARKSSPRLPAKVLVGRKIREKKYSAMTPTKHATEYVVHKAKKETGHERGRFPGPSEPKSRT